MKKETIVVYACENCGEQFYREDECRAHEEYCKESKNATRVSLQYDWEGNYKVFVSSFTLYPGTIEPPGLDQACDLTEDCDLCTITTLDNDEDTIDKCVKKLVEAMKEHIRGCLHDETYRLNYMLNRLNSGVLRVVNTDDPGKSTTWRADNGLKDKEED